MNDRAIDFAKAYRLSRLGFFLLAAGLLLVCALEIPGLIAQLMGPPALIQFWRLTRETGVATVSSTFVPWSTLAGSALLWASWDAPGWRRRSTLLMTMCLVDVGCWILDLGDPNFQGPHAYFRLRLGAALGWAQFALLAGLAGEVLSHLGVESVEERAKATRSLSASGAIVWFLYFVETTDLQAGWPLRPVAWATPQAMMLRLASDVIHAICLIQATALVVAAFRRLNSEIPRADAEAPDPRDPEDFPPRLDPFAGL